MAKKSALMNGNNNRSKKIFRKLGKREKAIGIVVLAALLVGGWLPGRLAVSTSPSLQHRIFFLSQVKTENINNGDYLVIQHTDGSSPFVRKGIKPDNNRLIKQVGCAPGMRLRRDMDRQFFCEDKLIGKALIKDSKGHLLPEFHFGGIVPDNSFFVVGSNPRSFDSKYFGFVHADDILYKALPLW